MPGPVRSVLLRLEVRPAGKRCNCAKNRKHVLVKGDVRFVVREHGPAAGEKGYCGPCAMAMIHKAQVELADLEAALSAA